MLQNKRMPNKLTSLWTDLRFCPSFYLYILLVWLFVSACACVLVYCVILYSQGLLCLCFDFESGNKGMNRLRTSHSEHGWWVQLCLEIGEIHSSTVAMLELGGRKYHINPETAGPHFWKWCNTHFGSCIEPWRKAFKHCHKNNWIYTVHIVIKPYTVHACGKQYCRPHINEIHCEFICMHYMHFIQVKVISDISSCYTYSNYNHNYSCMHKYI